ncbi:uncharacterized protein C2845_PM11G16630 [Panicum miliaceum]|uniref:F-box protein AT5G49610-like beta-propeller domain-containing protein n=1 Tax=Panicum miliaceum TaxID=4540 RepID=A0A3L6RTU6_PANMI|nr:uncharacterized protein C2845_PM11G16630 [Panicum miliaceum]
MGAGEVAAGGAVDLMAASKTSLKEGRTPRQRTGGPDAEGEVGQDGEVAAGLGVSGGGLVARLGASGRGGDGGGETIAICDGGGSVLYLVLLKGDQLCVWLRRMMDDEHGGAGEWVLRDSISLRETCGHLVEHGLEPAAGHAAVASVAGVGDNAEFVFLELHDSGVFVYMHFSSRKVEKVYQRDPDNDEITLVYPCSMVWLPVFPAIEQGE